MNNTARMVITFCIKFVFIGITEEKQSLYLMRIEIFGFLSLDKLLKTYCLKHLATLYQTTPTVRGYIFAYKTSFLYKYYK